MSNNIVNLTANIIRNRRYFDVFPLRIVKLLLRYQNKAGVFLIITYFIIPTQLLSQSRADSLSIHEPLVAD